MKTKFAACLTCIDGRIQLPIINWITENYEIKYVDMITEPGMDGLLSDINYDISKILKSLTISIDKHDSNFIFIVGHYDCAANKVEENIHKEQIIRSVDRIANYKSFCNVIGLWVSRNCSVQKLCEKK